MKKLLITLLVAFTSLTSVLCAEQPDSPPRYSFGYFDIGAIYVVPTIGFGYRWQVNHLGCDLSLEGASAVAVHAGFGSLRVLGFTKLGDQSFYGGIGLGAGVVGGISHLFYGFYAPQAIFGYKLQKTRFIEADIYVPNEFKYRKSINFHPAIVVRYGLGF